ncbi:hypothetical protein [Pseudomonas mosselii]|uniref:Uncharacterized protein n=1 Tax=Pseudomonas mosselii TaxID=78327 RepID=A0ABX9ATX5_9PSED|nr:hypothetical protein [Pseudomonas mosselii]QZP24501.1 hypothetical protein K5H97_16820 [Pseudomonas mosselii]
MSELIFEVKPTVFVEPVEVNMGAMTNQDEANNYVVCRHGLFYRLSNEEYDNLLDLMRISSGFPTVNGCRIVHHSPRDSKAWTPVR